jgi:mono/diheme cytochrome c family protein
MIKKILIIGGISILVIFALIQLVPYGKEHTNPPILQEPNWDSPQTRALAIRACYDCHSNETVWPWYSNIAPVSWMVYRDTMEGREALNFSEWNPNRFEDAVEEAAEVVLEGEMPPAKYFPTHPEARLTTAERQQLANGLMNTLGGGGTSEDSTSEDD